MCERVAYYCYNLHFLAYIFSGLIYQALKDVRRKMEPSASSFCCGALYSG